ncbi:hypothetical protein M409DRAFT_50463 [Zasmidium cellare ATCC 36951]|uniref:Uncharacterized protein n=1 Tax=Zasmidium cellare ATCC 36951 TaxID=1080233 RepID=A0A6A6D049_ZASCE|nr:uncharacterized protein M409DRAFT_50463 [Zasmidium cellare ATCC 36951]KAF2171830.1 hypothetical protein M409DRAFT_50463 [Zasmidium cellare ATCC 36951]
MVGTEDSVATGEFSPVSVVYQHYEDDNLEDFVAGAVAILDYDPEITRYDTIQLLLMLANSVECDADTLCYIVEAERLYKTARASSYLQPHEIASLDNLGEKLDQVMTLVYNPPDPKALEMEDSEVEGSDLSDSPSARSSSLGEDGIGEERREEGEDST